MSFSLSEKYRLEIHWTRIDNNGNHGAFYLTDAYFSGPVLKIADKINDKDTIRLDFCSQYTILVKNIYTATFVWEGITYKQNKIYLNKASLIYDNNTEVVPTLKDDDYIVIDTKNHENEKHFYNIFYLAYVVDKEHNMYNFRR